MARRAERLNPSTIREILKITERPGIISLAGGLPSAETFPVEAMREATARVLRDQPELRTVGRLTLLESFRCVHLVLWDETQRRLVSFREARASA